MKIYTILALILFVLSGCTSLQKNIEPELHVIGVYEGTIPKDDGKPWWSKCKEKSNVSCHQSMTQKSREVGGEIMIHISITKKPIILALSSYDKTKWVIKTEGAVNIKKIVLSGYHSQSVSGLPENTPVDVYTNDSSPCKKCFQGQGYFYSYKSPPTKKLKEITGLMPTSWQGKYQGKEFSIFSGMPAVN